MESIAKKHLDHKILKQNAAERAEQALTLAYNGGLFKVTPELISFAETLMRFDEYTGTYPDEYFLKDSYNNPIKIDDVHHFLHGLITKYNEVMNDWHNEYEQLRKIRKTDQL